MVNFPARTGRRRRVLNDEMLAGSTARIALHTPAEEPRFQPPRYSEAAGVEHHPQVTDFVPRRYRSIALLVAAGVASTLVLGGLNYVAKPLASAAGLDCRPFEVASTGSLAAWISAMVLLACSLTSLLVYSLRRHRIDDIRGRYRIWLAASIACLILSANSVAGLHEILAQGLAYMTGFTALRSGAVWWLGIAGLPLAWIGLRSLLDVRECRLATAFTLAAFCAYTLGLATYLSAAVMAEPAMGELVSASGRHVGHWLILAGVVAYARYVVLDAQGLIPLRQPARSRRASKGTGSGADSGEDSGGARSGIESRQKPSQSDDQRSATVKAWVDGRHPQRDSYGEDADEDGIESSRLSKSDRKRLRKLKAQQRAA